MKRRDRILYSKKISLSPIEDYKNKMVVYALIEPTTKLIRYVGKTQQCYEIRYRNHLKLRAGGRSKKDSWIFDLLKKRQKPDVIILSLHRSKKALDRKERYWIRHLTNLGFDLLNGTDGGTGGVQTEEVRRKMSPVQKKHF